MKIIRLKKEYREILATNRQLRTAIGVDIMADQTTVQRWAVGNSPKLTSDHFIAAFKKHAIIDENVEVTEILKEESTNHLQLA
jgi:hypothetical protein